VISTSSQCTTVFRSVLVNGNPFEEYVNRIGRPQFAITCAGDQFDEQGPGLASDEWLFADDIERLMMASHLNAARLGTVCKAMGADGARKAFLESIFEDASGYGFIALQADRYNRFIEEWKTNDDKAARPSDYRAEKRFGVVSAVGELGVDRASVQYWASIGWASGWVSAEQLREVGLTYDVLVGQTCVINGLGEVERIGNIPLPTCRY
jgi:hypothetical protein